MVWKDASMNRYTVPLNEVSMADVQRCGGKGAHLGELTRAGMQVPPGFCILSHALPYVIETNRLRDQIEDIAAGLDFEDPNAVEADTSRIREVLGRAAIPPDLEADIIESYRALLGAEDRHVAVRSSVAVKDSPISSFPGMMDTYHYVLGEREMLARIAECWASVWTARAAYARHRRQIAHDRSLIAPVVQLMIDAETAGVLFTANPITTDTSEIVIESNWGIGESVVSGQSMNDFFVLDKETLTPKHSVIAKKTVMFTIDHHRGSGRLQQEVPVDQQHSPTLSNAQLLELGEKSREIERHFGFPVDVEWAFEGGRLYILQARRIAQPGIHPEGGDHGPADG